MEQMNKRGQYLLMGMAILAAILVGLIAFLPGFKFIVIGVGFFVLMVIVLVKGHIHRSKAYAALGLFVLSMFFLLLGGFFGNNTYSTLALGPESYIQAPVFGYFKCEPVGVMQYTIRTPMTTGASGYILAPEDIQSWDLFISQTETTKWYSVDRRVVYKICDVDGLCETFIEDAPGFLKIKDVPTVHVPNLVVTDSVYVEYQRKPLLGDWVVQPNGAEWYIGYIPFALTKTGPLSGSYQYTSIEQGCNFPSTESDLQRIGDKLITSKNLVNNLINSKIPIQTQTSSANDKLPPYATRNFIEGYVPFSVENSKVVTYGGKEGYCLNNVIYGITSAETNSGIYKIVDTNYNSILNPSVTCCPGDVNPGTQEVCIQVGDTFKWQPNDVEGSCSLFQPCAGAGFQCTSSKTQITYDCVNTKCIPTTKTVDCCYDSDCTGGELCDLKDNECITLKPGIACQPGEVVYDGKCTNPIGTVCAWYESSGTKLEKDWGILGWRRLTGNPIVNPVPVCRTSGWVYGVIAAITIVVGFTIYIKSKKPQLKKKGRF